MIRVDRLVVPEEKSFCSTSSVRLLHCAHSRAMATPLMPPPITSTSKFWSWVWMWLLTYIYLDAFFGPQQHYFRTQLLGKRISIGSMRFSNDLWPSVMKDLSRAPQLRVNMGKE